MDSSFDSLEWRGEPVANRPDLSGGPHWHDIRTRLVTARAAFHALVFDRDAAVVGEPGSFNPDCARALSHLGHGSDHVNHLHIGIGKPVRDNPVSVAGTSSPGERG